MTKQYLVYFQEKTIDNASMDWDQIQGVSLVVKAGNDMLLDFEVEAQILDAATYQANEHNVEASYRGSWVDDNGINRTHELISNDMWYSQ